MVVLSIAFTEYAKCDGVFARKVASAASSIRQRVLSTFSTFQGSILLYNWRQYSVKYWN